MSKTMKNSFIANIPPKIKVYKSRWYILLLYILYTTIGQFQWVEYTIIANIVMRYYNVGPSTVDWTALVFMVVYPIFIIPALLIIDKLGLRVASIIGCLGTAIGVYIKLFSVGHNLFYLVIIGQVFVGIAQLIILPLPPKLAVTWFAEKEVSTACSLGVFGLQLGAALGFILPSTLVKNHDDLEMVGENLKTMCWVLAIAITPILIALIFYFPPNPKCPPNNIQNDDKFSLSNFFGSLQYLFTNGAFVMHLAASSISIGTYTVMGSLLNLFVLQYFENAQEDAGRMGLVMIISGAIGTPIIGKFLDKTRKFKESCFISMIFQIIGMILLICALEYKNKILVYASFAILGLFLNTYLPACIEFATELTYPTAESTTTGIVYAMSQTLGFGATIAISLFSIEYGAFWALIIITAFLALGSILTLVTPNTLKRQACFNNKNLTEFKSIPQQDVEHS
ncbi:unnamed protein product [Brassicogethes aeneus]|uniref:Major facilitator superfamily (MFS) profile domain-containing protein n=1 Tax=Brassicogethes aeneus TaxID=1431903 RepID=A0A9P0B2J9_BRAAE|nr:unnamed protein product [Brassicogethes aeneus]